MSKIDGFLREGKKSEEEFSALFLSKYPYCDITPATKEQDMFEHWDIKIRNLKTKKSVKVDVKGIKKDERSNKNPDDKIHWVELKNVRGNTGWLYGQADYFSLETTNDWIIINKKVLQQFIESKCDPSNFKIKHGDGSYNLYEVYRRRNNLDLIVKVDTNDIRKLSIRTLKKDKI